MLHGYDRPSIDGSHGVVALKDVAGIQDAGIDFPVPKLRGRLKKEVVRGSCRGTIDSPRPTPEELTIDIQCAGPGDGGGRGPSPLEGEMRPRAGDRSVNTYIKDHVRPHGDTNGGPSGGPSPDCDVLIPSAPGGIRPDIHITAPTPTGWPKPSINCECTKPEWKDNVIEGDTAST